MGVGGDTAGSYRGALSHRDFRLLTVSFLIDQVGTWASSVVLLAYLYDRTHSPGLLALTTAARWIPGLLANGYGGVLADRYDRAELMQISALISSVLASCMVVDVLRSGPLWILLVLNACSAIAGAPYRPAAGALTADVVGEKDLAAANALYSVLVSGTVVAGPALGGILIAAGRPELGFGVNAASFLVAAALVRSIRTRSRGSAGRRGESLRTQFTDGVKALVGSTLARTLVLFVFLDTAVYGASSVLLVAVSVDLGGGSHGYGYLLGGQALGGVLLAALANRLASHARLAPVIVGGMLLLCLPFAAIAVAQGLGEAVVLQVLAGAGAVLIDVLAITALQRDLPRELLSRVLGLVDMVVLAACVAGSAAAAALLKLIGLDATLVVIGIGFSALALVCSRPLVAADRRAASTLDAVRARVAVLTCLDLLAAAPAPALEALARDLEDVPVRARKVLIREGEEADALWVLVSGRLEVTVAGQPVSTVEAPGYVGEIGLLTGRPRSATVTASKSCVLWRISAEAFAGAVSQLGASASITDTARFRLARASSDDARQQAAR
ncbi:MAG TPA: MFS transporter [Mycobacteriales bacterium]|nr:MFS transporter [Mycobacteriales bacterium]